jgi:regulator of ribonuclease activity A
MGERDLPVRFAGVDFLPGQFLYADGNGVIVSARELSAGA